MDGNPPPSVACELNHGILCVCVCVSKLALRWCIAVLFLLDSHGQNCEYNHSGGLYILWTFFKCLSCVPVHSLCVCVLLCYVFGMGGRHCLKTSNYALQWFFPKHAVCVMRCCQEVRLCLLWDIHTFSLFCCLLRYTHSQIKSESASRMGMVRGTHPLTPGSKEVEGWRGQATWPGKGKGGGTLDRLDRSVEIGKERRDWKEKKRDMCGEWNKERRKRRNQTEIDRNLGRWV